jgi:hypothetical protein
MSETRVVKGIWYGATKYWAYKTRETYDRKDELLKVSKVKAIQTLLNKIETGCSDISVDDKTHFDIHVESKFFDMERLTFATAMVNVQGTYPFNPTTMKKIIPLFKDMAIPKVESYQGFDWDPKLPHYVEDEAGYVWDKTDCVSLYYKDLEKIQYVINPLIFYPLGDFPRKKVRFWDWWESINLH